MDLNNASSLMTLGLGIPSILANIYFLGREAYRRHRIRRLLIGYWEGDMHLANRSKDRYYKFHAAFSHESGKLAGRVFYEGRQGIKDGELEIEGFDLLSDGENLDSRLKQKQSFLLRFHTKSHVRIQNKTEIQQSGTIHKVSEYNRVIKSWILHAQIEVSVEIGDEGQKLIGVWDKR